LPEVNGFITDKNSNEPINDAIIYWTDLEDNEKYYAHSLENGMFTLNQISKYVKWQIIAMDMGVIGEITIKKNGYYTEKVMIGELGTRAIDIVQTEIKLSKVN